jgi:hypothetical protein
MEVKLIGNEGLKYYNDNNYREYLKNKKISINIYSCDIIKNVNIFTNIYKLCLLRCEGIKDVSLLGNLHSLSLIECVNIVDVSALGNVHTLNLSGCKKIKDISALKNVHELNICGCRRIKNIEKSNIEILAINNIIEGIHLLKNIKELSVLKIYKNKGELKKLQKHNKNKNIKLYVYP